MATIIPAILEETVEGFDSKLEEILQIPDLQTIQIDFSDGVFTERKTLPIAEVEILNPAYEWEAHLMVKDPRAYFFDAKLLGFKKIIFHFEAVEKTDLQQIADEITELKMVPVLAFLPETDPEEAVPYLPYFQNFLILDVKAGYQGGELQPGVFDHIQKLRNHQKNAIIEVDGGVKISNIKELYKAGADNFVVGSALFEKTNEKTGENGQENTPAQNFERFRQEINT